MPNLDLETVRGFGDEWERFDQSELTADERAISQYSRGIGYLPNRSDLILAAEAGVGRN
jgi:hypothetical protein